MYRLTGQLLEAEDKADQTEVDEETDEQSQPRVDRLKGSFKAGRKISWSTKNVLKITKEGKKWRIDVTARRLELC